MYTAKQIKFLIKLISYTVGGAELKKIRYSILDNNHGQFYWVSSRQAIFEILIKGTFCFYILSDVAKKSNLFLCLFTRDQLKIALIFSKQKKSLKLGQKHILYKYVLHKAF